MERNGLRNNKNQEKTPSYLQHIKKYKNIASVIIKKKKRQQSARERIKFPRAVNTSTTNHHL